MPFQQNQMPQGQYNVPHQGEKKKSNFRIGKVYGTDGILDVSIWNSEKGGIYAILSIKAAVGKDPSTGSNVYVQKMSGDLPSVFLSVQFVRALLDYMKLNKPETINCTMTTPRGPKISMVGSNSNVKLTVDGKNGPATITLESIPVGTANINAAYYELIDMLEIAHKHAQLKKLDTEEFSNVIGGDNNNDSNSQEEPF